MDNCSTIINSPVNVTEPIGHIEQPLQSAEYGLKGNRSSNQRKRINNDMQIVLNQKFLQINHTRAKSQNENRRQIRQYRLNTQSNMRRSLKVVQPELQSRSLFFSKRADQSTLSMIELESQKAIGVSKSVSSNQFINHTKARK